MVRFVSILACCLVAALAAGGALAATGGGPVVQAARAPKNLWATVNICDTAKHPDALGIRARAPGDGKRGKIWMRFIAEYMKDGSWVRVKKGGRSGWKRIGSAKDFEYQESGWTFDFDELAPDEQYRMRGLVKFQWRRDGKVRRSAHARTSGGHTPDKGGDPKGYSKATCFLSGSA
jgi:hypothetical protein